MNAKFIFTILLSSLLLGAYDATAARPDKPLPADGQPLVYNVRDFGAKGDGKADDAQAIQSAIDHVMEHGGGTLYFPNGRYRLVEMQERDKVRAHLVIRPYQTPNLRDYVMIRLQGENCVVTPCSYASHTAPDTREVWNNGTILFSDIDGEIQTDPSKAPACILAAGAGDNVYGLNQAVVRIQDLAFRAKAEPGKYPRLSGINMAYAATVYTDNVLVFSSTRNALLTAPSKDGHYSAGFIGPRVWCNPEQELRNTYVKSAFRYGFIFSEHMNANDLSVWNCENAYVFSRMDHSSWFGRIHAQNCKHILTSLDTEFSGHGPGSAFVKIEQLGVELNNGQVPLDFNYESFVRDPKNNLYGQMWYHIVMSNVGADNSYYKTDGAANLKATPSF